MRYIAHQIKLEHIKMGKMFSPSTFKEFML